MKQKISVVLEVAVSEGVGETCCSPNCPFYPVAGHPNVCRVFGDELELAEVGEDGFRCSPQCFRGAGNYNILRMFLAGE